MKGNVIRLAVGVIIGAAFARSCVARRGRHKSVARQGDRWSQFRRLVDESRARARCKTEVLWKYGNFLQVTFQFLVIAFVLFMLIRTLNKLKTPDRPRRRHRRRDRKYCSRKSAIAREEVADVRFSARAAH
jgi:large conductance mechanosensitive channel